MNQEQYPFLTSKNFLDYEFESIGPKGVIRKRIRYTPRYEKGLHYFNIGFGDVQTGNTINDLAVSNNDDTHKLLSTVAGSVVDFTDRVPDAVVFASGSTPARTRLYQIGISLHWASISALFHIYVRTRDDIWQPFQKNRNYLAFLAFRK